MPLPESLPADFLDAPRPAARRYREKLPAGIRLTVPDPQIKEVMDTGNAEHIPVEHVLGTDKAALMELRMEVKSALLQDAPMYRCSQCQVPVYICCHHISRLFYFKHTIEDKNCPAVTRSEMGRDEADARKYNGAKESRLHRKMKEWVVACMGLEPRFSNIRVESTWKGNLGKWRKPDVQAMFDEMPVAFEIQLSTTYLDVIAGRRQFYLQNGGLLFWVFAEFDSDYQRLTEEDVFYNNNQNAFVINARTVEASLKAGVFLLDCVWTNPPVGGVPGLLNRRLVRFDELQFNLERQQAFYFDYAGAVLAESKGRAAARAQKLREDFEVWWGDRYAGPEPARKQWLDFRARFELEGFHDLPADDRDLETELLTGLYSARHNRPYGQKKKQLVEVAHSIAQAYKRHLTWFMHAIRHYQRIATIESQGQPHLWAAKYARCQEEFRNDRKPFEPMKSQQAFIEFLFPELAPLPYPKKKPPELLREAVEMNAAET